MALTLLAPAGATAVVGLAGYGLCRVTKDTGASLAAGIGTGALTAAAVFVVALVGFPATSPLATVSAAGAATVVAGGVGYWLYRSARSTPVSTGAAAGAALGVMAIIVGWTAGALWIMATPIEVIVAGIGAGLAVPLVALADSHLTAPETAPDTSPSLLAAA